ncbi:MAG: hypothetical protein KBA26_15185, partial [Candidatus Delongbacteria bacterium]|nr:hypothetical protein [Candidatus Delongbacteria bacterium]
MIGRILRLTGVWRGWLWLGLAAALLKVIYLIPVHPDDLRRDPASDPAQYISLAEQVSHHILEQPLAFGTRLIGGKMTPQQMAAAGLDVESVQNVFRAPTWIGLIGMGIRLFGYSDQLIWGMTVLLFAASSLFFLGWLRFHLSPGWSLAGWIVFVLYPPFYFMCESALVENILIFQIVLFLYFMSRLFRSWNRRDAIWTGLSLMALVMAKPFFYAWLWPVWIGILICIWRNAGRGRWSILSGMGIGMLILLVPIKLVVFRTTGQWDILHPVSTEIQNIFQGTGMWNSATPDYDGWHYNHKHDSYFFSVDDSLLRLPTRVLEDGRQANYLDVNHYARTCNAAFRNYLRDHYPAYIMEFLKKTGFLLIFPFSAIFHYNNGLWLDGIYDLVFHWILLMGALLGLGFSFKSWKKYWAVWLLILYHLGLYGMTHIEARFNLTLMPALIMLACFGIGSMVHGIM